MSHTIRKKSQLLNRVSRIAGQVEAIERALNAESECGVVLQLIASARGAMNGLMAEVIEEHIRSHVLGLGDTPDAIKLQGADELVEVVRTYLK
ncbi:MAG: metal/formaldehyde-sensitive transcriptional repressor [Bauldia sp.]